MERDVLLSFGASENIQESYFDRSDRFFAWICARCGLLSVANPSEHYYFCVRCRTGEHVFPTRFGRGNMIHHLELGAMHILTRFKLGNGWEPAFLHALPTKRNEPNVFLPSLHDKNEPVHKGEKNDGLMSYLSECLAQFIPDSQNNAQSASLSPMKLKAHKRRLQTQLTQAANEGLSSETTEKKPKRKRKRNVE